MRKKTGGSESRLLYRTMENSLRGFLLLVRCATCFVLCGDAGEEEVGGRSRVKTKKEKIKRRRKTAAGPF
jgi:hypothetical protein